MQYTTKLNLVRSTFTAMFAALICIGSFISIPLPGGVPITIQNLFAVLAGLLFGGIQGAGAVGLFLILGTLGVPVFSGGTSGMPILVGPTGGFLWGYFVGALVAGIIVGTPRITEKKHTVKMAIRIAAASLAAFAIQYLIGIPWFMHIMASKGNSLSLAKALSYTLIPFIPGDLTKFCVSIPLAMVLRPVLARYLYPNDAKEAEEFIAELKKQKER